MDKAQQMSFLKAWYADNKSQLQSQQALIAAIKADGNVEDTIRSLYLSLFNKSVSGCGNCLADAFAELMHFPQEKLQEIMDCKFKLRSGVLLMDSKNVLPMATSANLTDEIAIAYIKDNPARKDLFEHLPENLEELINGTPAETAEKKQTRKKK